MARILLCILLLGFTSVAASENLPATPVNSCTTAEHQQFDFWLGDWDVTANNKPAGENRISKVFGGCALAENWTSASSNFSGGSYNIYDQSRKRWHQSWVDSSGTLLQLEGGLVSGVMVLQGVTTDKNGKPIQQRISWSQNPDGSVRQLWQSRIENNNWQTVFDGHYRRKSKTLKR